MNKWAKGYLQRGLLARQEDSGVEKRLLGVGLRSVFISIFINDLKGGVQSVLIKLVKPERLNRSYQALRRQAGACRQYLTNWRNKESINRVSGAADFKWLQGSSCL